jgi:hypothetical protein
MQGSWIIANHCSNRTAQKPTLCLHCQALLKVVKAIAGKNHSGRSEEELAEVFDADAQIVER